MPKKPISASTANFQFFTQQQNYNLPEMREVKNSGGYLTYGTDNQYPQSLLNMFLQSSLHNAIVLRKVDEIVAGGLISTDPTVTAWLDNCNSQGGNFQDIFRKLVLDYLVFGGFTTQMVFNKAANDLAGIYYLDFAKFRYSLNADKIKYARDWGMQRVKTIEYELYKGQTSGTSVYYYNGTLTREWYPVPEYIGSLSYIQASIEIANFHLMQIKNGMFPSLLITLKNGNPTLDEKHKIINDLKRDLQGSPGAGRFMVDFCENAQEPNMTIQPIEGNNLDSRFITLQNQVSQNIFIGHRINNTAIFGVPTPSGLGQQISPAESLEMFQKTYVVPQQIIILRTLNKLLSVKFPNIDLKIKPLRTVGSNFTNEFLISSMMTTAEIRANLKELGWIEVIALKEGEKLRIDENPITTVDTTAKQLEKPADSPTTDLNN